MGRFKCIGAEDETPRQEFLRVVEREMYEENVPVKARPRPEPRRKTREMQLPRKDHGTSWFCVGYIAKNLHYIIKKDKPVEAGVTHINFSTHFARIGFYQSITITRGGDWKKYVLRKCQSSLYHTVK